MVDREVRERLVAEVHDRLAPEAFAVHVDEDEVVVDLLRDDGSVLWPRYAQGPDELLACLSAEQRYLVEDIGHGAVSGVTYLDKAKERVRRAEQQFELVVEQRVRNRIIEYLELAASFADQRAYEQATPIANIPYEVINQWEDQLPKGPEAIVKPGVYTADERDALARFHTVWNATADAVPNNHPSLAEVQRLPAWEDLRAEAASALAVFARRGKLSEEHVGA